MIRSSLCSAPSYSKLLTHIPTIHSSLKIIPYSLCFSHFLYSRVLCLGRFLDATPPEPPHLILLAIADICMKTDRQTDRRRGVAIVFIYRTVFIQRRTNREVSWSRIFTSTLAGADSEENGKTTAPSIARMPGLSNRNLGASQPAQSLDRFCLELTKDISTFVTNTLLLYTCMYQAWFFISSLILHTFALLMS